MMGKDVEKLISGIDAIKNALASGITSLSSAIAYQINTVGMHGEAETPVGGDSSGFTSGATSALSAIESDLGKLKSLGDGMYTGTTTFNNSCGSPWTEIEDMKNAVKSLSGFGSVAFVGQKAGLLGLMNMCMSRTVDAKWAIAIYHDYVQRGFDTKYNGKSPSITFQDSIDKTTIGNGTQAYGDNVNVPTPSIDPF